MADPIAVNPDSKTGAIGSRLVDAALADESLLLHGLRLGAAGAGPSPEPGWRPPAVAGARPGPSGPTGSSTRT
jgi:hypothetical protein